MKQFLEKKKLIKEQNWYIHLESHLESIKETGQYRYIHRSFRSGVAMDLKEQKKKKKKKDLQLFYFLLLGEKGAQFGEKK